MATFAQILEHKFPGTEWTIRGDEYDTLIWADGNASPKPTEEELRVFNDEVDAAVADRRRKARQQAAFASDTPDDYTLRAFEIAIDALAEMYRIIQDMRAKIRPEARTAAFDAWDAQTIQRVNALRQRIQELREID